MMTKIVATAGRFDIGYIPKRSKKRTDTSATALFPVTLTCGDTPPMVVTTSVAGEVDMIWGEGEHGFLHRHQIDDELLGDADLSNPLFFDTGTHKKTLTLDDTTLFSIRELVLDGRTAAAAAAQRTANGTILAPDGLYAPTAGAYFRVDLSITNDKMRPTALFVPIDGHRGVTLAGCYPLFLIDQAINSAVDMGWTVHCPFETKTRANEAMIVAMLRPALEDLCDELIGRGMPNRNASNFSVGHLEAHLAYTDPENPPSTEDLIGFVEMIENDAERGDYTNPTGDKVLKSTLRNRLMNALLEHHGRKLIQTI